MKKLKTGILSYSQLFEYFSESFTKDYNKKKDIEHTYTILLNSLSKTIRFYYWRYFLWVFFTLVGLVFLFLPKEQLIGYIAFFGWTFVVSIALIIVGVPHPESLSALRSNVGQIIDDVKDSDYTVEEVLSLIIDAKKKKQLKSEILLQKYYDYVSPHFSGEAIKNPVGRLLCYQIINQVSEIPITDNETKLLIASLLRIGITNLEKTHLTNLRKINSLTSLDSSDIKINQKEYDFLKNQVNTSIIFFERSLNKAKELYNKLDTIK